MGTEVALSGCSLVLGQLVFPAKIPEHQEITTCLIAESR